MYAIKQTEGYQSSVNNDIARTLKKLGTSKAEKCTKQFFSLIASCFKLGPSLKGKNLLQEKFLMVCKITFTTLDYLP